jgi:hypothetical protein
VGGRFGINGSNATCPNADPQARADRLEEDFDGLENGVVVGRIFFLDAVAGRRAVPWMWASGHNGDLRRAAHGYEPTREAAMAAFAKSWRESFAAIASVIAAGLSSKAG